MTRIRLLIVAGAAALFVGVAGSLSGVAATTFGASHPQSHSGSPTVQAEVPTATFATKPADPCKAGDATEDKAEKDAAAADRAKEKAAKLSKAEDATEDKAEKTAAKAENTKERADLKACEAARKKTATTK